MGDLVYEARDRAMPKGPVGASRSPVDRVYLSSEFRRAFLGIVDSRERPRGLEGRYWLRPGQA